MLVVQPVPAGSQGVPSPAGRERGEGFCNVSLHFVLPGPVPRPYPINRVLSAELISLQEGNEHWQQERRNTVPAARRVDRSWMTTGTKKSSAFDGVWE